MTSLELKTSDQTKPKCPHCYNNSSVVKIGSRQTKAAVSYRFKCKTCNKTFSKRPLKYAHYPPNIIFSAISNYNLGYTKEETSGILSRKFRTKFPISTIHSWLKRYKNICTFSSLRKRYTIDPQTIIKSKKLHHIQVYNFKYHDLKLNLSAKKFPDLRRYIHELFTRCPNDLFKAEGPRCSSLRIDIKPRKVTKYNNAPKLAEYALLLSKSKKDRHQKVQDFMLINDSATITTELPIFLLPKELSKSKQKLYGLDISDVLTGHIDILQVRFDQIHILDYKPDAKSTDQRAAEQVFLYSLALSKRTNIPLHHFTCAYFDENNYYQFKPGDY